MAVVSLRLNGKKRTAGEPRQVLLDWLRREGGCTGAKEGCAEGDCGACSVLMSAPDGSGYRPVNACLLLVGQVAGEDITTVEGLGRRTDPHPLQAEIAASGGSQCGFCTPGFVIAGAALLHRNRTPGDADIHDALAGNLCRCTGYRPIVDAIRSAGAASPPLPAPRISTCPVSLDSILHPRSIRDATRLAADPNTRLVAGGTDLILHEREARSAPARLISLRRIAELRRVRLRGDRLVIGGACPLEDLLPPVEERWPSFGRILRRFGSPQIRSLATLGGNLTTASPIGDAAPCLLALDATVHISGPIRRRSVPMAEFQTGYRKTVLRNAEMVTEIHVPLRGPNSVFRAWKVSKRFDQDISTVSAAFRIDRDLAGRTTAARAAFGGMRDRPFRAPGVEAALLAGDFAAAAAAVEVDTQPISDLRGSARYRLLAAAGLLRRFELALQGRRRLELVDL